MFHIVVLHLYFDYTQNTIRIFCRFVRILYICRQIFHTFLKTYLDYHIYFEDLHNVHYLPCIVEILWNLQFHLIVQIYYVIYSFRCKNLQFLNCIHNNKSYCLCHGNFLLRNVNWKLFRGNMQHLDC